MLTRKRCAIALVLLAAASPAFIMLHGVPGRPQESAGAAHHPAAPTQRVPLTPRIMVLPTPLPRGWPKALLPRRRPWEVIPIPLARGTPQVIPIPLARGTPQMTLLKGAGRTR